jgi:hypothetical protein
MLKKTVFLALLLNFSTFSFAENADSKLTVAPYNLSEWGYQYATVAVNNNPPTQVRYGITIPVAVNDNISLVVYAMNSRPQLDDSCKNIQIREEGSHQLLFELRKDWLIHCQYS